ncbi:hypothetical protein CAEBREN_00057 [Caenorhabditis brenneri]|uniref:Uncharacterized protein n=1 Tax=Caenorhabditis brenneri TaxID=135651 RepID=G0MXE1_CAEBE|nr:hypothetical protein CAEBREN_00057 [Caenorhabditis brenneri]
MPLMPFSHDYHEARNELYRDRCEIGFRVFGKIVENLTGLSNRYNRQFFSPPLQCAEQMLRICKRIDEGLKKFVPNYELLFELNEELVAKQQKQFLFMRKAADIFLRSFGGFETKTIAGLYNQWISIAGWRHDEEAFLCLESRFPFPNIAHEEFMENFEISQIDIFWRSDALVESISDGSEFSLWDFDDEADDDLNFERLSPNHHLRRRLSLLSVATEDSIGDDITYKTVREADFEAFERTWVEYLETEDTTLISP